jgi:hypothetical protein
VWGCLSVGWKGGGHFVLFCLSRKRLLAFVVVCLSVGLFVCLAADNDWNWVGESTNGMYVVLVVEFLVHRPVPLSLSYYIYMDRSMDGVMEHHL